MSSLYVVSANLKELQTKRLAVTSPTAENHEGFSVEFRALQIYPFDWLQVSTDLCLVPGGAARE